MLAYPQLETGAISQFPVKKTRRARTIRNQTADGTTIQLADPAGGATEWQLWYEDLADEEAAALLAFFASAEGTLNSFTFLDPTGNLLAWSEALDNAVWQRDPLLALTGGAADPAGGTRAWQAANGGTGSQGIRQTLAAPGDFQYCMSVYLRAATPTVARLQIGSQTAERYIGGGWNRVTFSASGDAGASSTTFGIAVDGGATVQIYGPQVEPQNGASAYKTSTTGGVYPDARMGSDSLTITATDVNRHSCKVTIIHVNHL